MTLEKAAHAGKLVYARWRATSRSNWMRPSMEISLYSRVPYALLLNCASRIAQLAAPHTHPRHQAIMLHFMSLQNHIQCS